MKKTPKKSILSFYFLKNWIFILISILLACNPNKNTSQDRENLLLAVNLIQILETPYKEVEPTPGEITFAGNVNRTISFQPTCSRTPKNIQYKFYYKKGRTNNLLINFMGGGACWDPKNCLGEFTPTYFNQASRFSPLAARYVFDGILNERIIINPFRDWNVVFIPYCTGDLHWGSKVVTYQDPRDGSSIEFHHKGFDNVMSVLHFIINNEEFKPSPGSKVFITGQSAGGYGAIFHFPYIKELFPNSEVHVIGDAASGGVPIQFYPNIDTQWGIQNTAPDWIPGISPQDLSQGLITLGDFYEKVALFYPNSRIGQFSTVFDGNQRFFYDVQHQIKGLHPYTAPIEYEDRRGLWGNSDGRNVPPSLSCSWIQKQINNFQKPAYLSNYRYYLAAGDFHTISTSRTFYSERIGDFPVFKFYESFIHGENFQSYNCIAERGIQGCNPPPSVNLSLCNFSN